MNEIRNELLLIMNMMKEEKEDKNFYIKNLLERFEFDIKRKLENIKYEKNELEENLKLVEYVKKELGVK